MYSLTGDDALLQSCMRLKIMVVVALAFLTWDRPTIVSAQLPDVQSEGHGSIWDFLGVQQICDVTQECSKLANSTALFSFMREGVLNPVLALTGLQPGSAPTSFGPPNLTGTTNSSSTIPSGGTSPAPSSSGAPGANPAGTSNAAPVKPPASAKEVAGKLAGQTSPAKIKAKAKAIRFLGQQDCLCYPEVVDALLEALNDCAEEVRFEALLALRNGCTGGFCKGCIGGKLPPDYLGCNCCACQDKVLTRLSRLLLDRNINGTLKECSKRVRKLAAQMIQECINARGTSTLVEQESGATSGSNARPDPPIQPQP